LQVPDRKEEGFVKILVLNNSHKLLGAIITERRAGEMINEITTAGSARLGLGAWAAVIMQSHGFLSKFT